LKAKTKKGKNMSGLSGATTGTGYVSNKGLPWIKTKDDVTVKLLPVLDILGLKKYYFTYYNHSWYNPADVSSSKFFTCACENKIQGTSLGEYCPSCEVYGHLKLANETEVTLYTSQGLTKEQVKEATKNSRELAYKFKPKWQAAAPAINVKTAEFGWMRMSGSLIKVFEARCVKDMAKHHELSPDDAVNRVLSPTHGYSLEISHPTPTTWAVDLDGSNGPGGPLFTPDQGALSAVVDKWVDDLSSDLTSCKASGRPSKIEKMHKFKMDDDKMYEATALWAQRLGAPMPTPPSGAQTASAPIAVPAAPVTAAMAGQVVIPQGVPQQVAAPAMVVVDDSEVPF
jgi:hypothetical protein